MGEGDRTIEHWKVLARIAPGDAEARDRLLPAPGGAPRVEEIGLLERQRAADPRDEASRRRLVELYRGAGDGPRAVGAQRELAGLRPRDNDPLALVGRLLVEQDRGPEAIAAYERAVEIAPDRLDSALALAQLYEWGNDPRRALALLERVAKARPADRALQERVAALAQGTEDGGSALAALDRLAALSPPDAPYPQQAGDPPAAAKPLPQAIPRPRPNGALQPGAPRPPP